VKSYAFILLSIIVFGWVTSMLAENEDPYFARTWQAADGLPDNRVVGIAQTADGYLWVATQGGVVRFDGVRFQRVSFADSPDRIAGTMRVLFLDRLGRVWLAKEEEGLLFCFNGTEVQMVTADQGLPRNETQRSMAVDGKGDLWIAYRGGKVIRYHPGGKAEAFTVQDGLPGGGDICWLASGRDGVLWFAKGSQVGVFRNGRFSVLENFGSAALQITPARSGGVWVCAGQKILKFDEGSDAVKLADIISEGAGGTANFRPSALLEDREGAVWVGTEARGLFRCDSNAVIKVNVSDPGILSLAEDREGNLWVGTRGGLNRVQRRMISLVKPAGGTLPYGVESVCQDATGALWLVGENGVLVRGWGTNWTVPALAAGPEQPHVTCVASDTNGAVWIGTWGGGVYQWSGGQFKDLGLQASLDHKSPRSLLVARNGDLWMGADSLDTLYRLRGGTLKAFVLPPGHRIVRAMAEDAAGNVWAGASDGLLVQVTGDQLVDESAKSSSLSIRCLHALAGGDLWIGYASAGVGRFRNGSITRFSSDQGLPNDFVSQILEDGRGNLWFAGNQGIFSVSEQDFDDVANGVAARIRPVVYGRNEDLPGLQGSFDFYPNSLRAADDRLFFSMLSGLIEVQPDIARLNYHFPEVFIERVNADKQTLTVYQEIKLAAATNLIVPVKTEPSGDHRILSLPPGLQQVQFEFTALSFVDPENMQFRYKLEGLDKDWVDAGNRRTASYTHPPPGRYEFKVIACNNNGIWNKTGDTLAVVFEPFFWETLWFKVLVIAGSFAVLCQVVVLVLRRRHKLVIERLEHQRALELERARIARDLHDDLGVGLTEIGLLGDLVGTESQLPQTGRDRVDEITGRARSLAASLDEIVWAINPANDTSQSLMEYFFDFAQKLLGRAGIRCRLELVEPMPPGILKAEHRHEVFYAFKEALNNVIRHASATEVHVRLAAQDGCLSISVADNGRGFVQPGGDGSHDGLVGMRERMRQLGGRCEINGASGSGTTVTFIIPMQTNTKS
jgi:signal transduction histidine kinase/ligand-binding sensor domain-containing protein